MTDIFREVDEEVRAQKLEAFWKKYSTLLVAVAVLLIAAVGGWRYFVHVNETAAAASAVRFEEALDLSRQGKPADAEKVLNELAGSGADGYRRLSRFRAAAEIAATDPGAGAKAFDALAADAALDKTLQDLARLRAAALLVDTISPDDLAARIGGLSQAGQPWRNGARELLGLARFKAGDMKGASGYFEQMALDPAATDQMRQRAQIMLGLVRGGTVPTK
ncbi:MAG: tetratricopeptide repeat protein [Beijerinckiaceae bacterium]|nr:tetratricopeptide repeat protein [Beijerinckiaceae bacterium]